VLEQRERPAVLEFLSGLFSGIGIILLTLLIAILATSTLEKVLPYRDRTDAHMVAFVWAVLALGLGLLVSAGLVTAAALFLLLDSACWNFSF